MQLNMGALEKFRVEDGLDAFIVPNFAQSVLRFDPAALQAALEANYPIKGAGDAILAGFVQWVNGDNEALNLAFPRQKSWKARRAGVEEMARQEVAINGTTSRECPSLAAAA